MDKEKRNRILLAALAVTFAAVVVWQFVLSGDAPAPRSAVAAPTVRQTSGAAPRGKAAPDANEEGYRPLALSALERPHGAGTEPARNIFIYYVPPPKPVVAPPEPPAPLRITTLSPSSVYAGTGEFTLRVAGVELPSDARLLLNSQPLASQLKGDSEITVTVPKTFMAAAGQVQVEVRDGSGKLFSNKLQLLVNAPPPPPYRYVGRIDNLAFLSGGGMQADERTPLLLGSTIDNRWKLADIGDESLTVEDVVLHIRHPIRFSPEGGAVGATAPGEVNPALQQLRDARRRMMRERGIEPSDDQDDDGERKDPERPN